MVVVSKVQARLLLAKASTERLDDSARPIAPCEVTNSCLACPLALQGLSDIWDLPRDSSGSRRAESSKESWLVMT